MDCTTHTKAVCDDFKNPFNPCHEVPLCVYDIKEVEEKVQPRQLDGNADTYTEVERASMAHALQPYEYRPGVYDLFTDEELPKIQLRLRNAYTALQTRGAAFRKQVIWLSIDPGTSKRILKSGNNPEKFLNRMEQKAKKYFGDMNIDFVVSENPPDGFHGTVIFADTHNAILSRSKRQRVLAVKDLLYMGDLGDLKVLQPIIEEIRRKEPGVSEDDLYDRAGQNAKVEALLPFHGGWTTLGGEDIGNNNAEDISYVRVYPARLHRKAEEFLAGLLVAHEVGHALGLQHVYSTHYVEEPQCIMQYGFVGIATKEAKNKRRKKRLEVDELIKKLNPKLLNQMGGKEGLYVGLQELPTPPYRFCDQASEYLHFVLGHQ